MRLFWLEQPLVLPETGGCFHKGRRLFFCGLIGACGKIFPEILHDYRNSVVNLRRIYLNFTRRDKRTGMIGLFNDCFPPIMDGVSVATQNYAYWLHRKGEEVCVVTPTADSPVDDNVPYPVYRYVSMPIPKRKPYRMGFPYIDFPFYKQINSLPFTLLHAHCPFSSGELAMRLAHSRRIPIVATFHSKYRADFERVIPSRLIVDLIIKRIVNFYNRADEVWIPQASVEETLREYGYRGRVEVVDNGNDFAGTYSEEERGAFRKELGVADDIPLFLYVGQHIMEKNLEFLLHSVALLKDVPFRMFFIGTGYAAGELEELSKRLGIDDRVSFLGCMTERERLRKYYLAADLFLFPSLYDNAPLVVREAAALRTPSVLIGGSTAAAVVKDGVNGFLSENDKESFAGRIRDIMQDRPRLEQVARRASETLARSWEDIAGEVSERYASLIKRCRP